MMAAPASTRQTSSGQSDLKSTLVKGLAAGIGLASESISEYKQRKKHRKAEQVSGLQHNKTEQESRHIGEATLPRSEKQMEAGYTDKKIALDETDDHDEKLWALDDAQDEFNAPPAYAEKDPAMAATNNNNNNSNSSSSRSGSRSPKPSETKSLDKILQRYPAAAYPATPGAKLAQPVILPQKRPKERTRGFVKAYAPSLGPCGIPQDMFLDFLSAFDASTQSSPWLDAMNIAGNGLSFIPHFPMLAGIAITISVEIAKDVQNRTRTNSFLAKANDEIFKPRGLYCLIMAYNPDDENNTHTSPVSSRSDLSSTIMSSSMQGGSTTQRLRSRLRESSGKTQGEGEMPAPAPLIFPALEGPGGAEYVHSRNKREKMKKASDYVHDYYDKRAQVKFATKHAGSVLAMGPTPKFTSRFSDPNHPASNGSFRSLITGGLINPPPMTRDERQQQQSREMYGHQGFTFNRDTFGRPQRPSNAPAPPAPYGGSNNNDYYRQQSNRPAPYGGSSQHEYYQDSYYRHDNYGYGHDSYNYGRDNYSYGHDSYNHYNNYTSDRSGSATPSNSSGATKQTSMMKKVFKKVS